MGYDYQAECRQAKNNPADRGSRNSFKEELQEELEYYVNLFTYSEINPTITIEEI